MLRQDGKALSFSGSIGRGREAQQYASGGEGRGASRAHSQTLKTTSGCEWGHSIGGHGSREESAA